MIDNSRLVEIYELHKKELFIYIYRFCRSQESAEDILHDCFENLIKYSQRFTIQDQNIKSFLYKTAHNLSINHLKRSNKILYVPIEEDSKITDDTYITGNIEASDLNNKIYELLQDIDGLSRSVFIMKKELGKDLREIAEYHGISERTARRKLNKTLEFLADSLKNLGLMLFFYMFTGIILFSNCPII